LSWSGLASQIRTQTIGQPGAKLNTTLTTNTDPNPSPNPN